MSTKTPISIGTFSDLVHYNYSIALFCLNCDRWHDLDIAALVDAGYGSEPYVGKTYKCKKCGDAAEVQVRPGVTWPKGSSPYTTVAT